MKFYLCPAATFKTDVPLSVPEGLGIATVSMTFLYKDKDELDQWIKENKSKPTAEALVEIIKGWEVLGPDDLPVEVNKNNMITLSKKYPNALTEIFRGYYKAIADSRLKN